MDALTHVFLPLAGIYVWRKEGFNRPYHFLLVFFAILPDLDKMVGYPYLHSLIPLTALVAGIVVVERIWRKSTFYSGIIAFLLFSHLVLDLLDGNNVPLLYPLTGMGIQLTFPLQITFHSPTFSLSNLPVDVIIQKVNPTGFSYPLLSGYGVASLILFVIVFWGMRRRN